MNNLTRFAALASGLFLAFTASLSPAQGASGQEASPAPQTRGSGRVRPAAATSIILQQNRIRVSVAWKSQYTGQSGDAWVIPQTDEFAYFYFSDPGNPEVFVKVLDFGEPSPFLAFYSGLTDFEYTVTYESLCNNKRLVVTKPAGSFTGGGDNKTLTWCSTGTGIRPVADFTFSPASPVTGERVTFTNTSQNALTYYWDFADGNVSTEINPVKTFKTAGTYNVLLQATNSFGTTSVKKAITVRPPQASPMRVNLTNTLVEDVNVWVDGKPVGSVPVGQMKGFDITSTTSQTSIEAETIPLEYQGGGTVPGSQTLVQNWTLEVQSGAVKYLETAVRFPSTRETFYAPLLTNSTTVQLVPVVNHLDPSQFVCPCAILPGTRDAYIGYYLLTVTSRFSIFRVNDYPNGPYRYWENFADYWNDKSGAVLFNATVAPAKNGGDEAVEMTPPPPRESPRPPHESTPPDRGELRTPAYRGPYRPGALPEIPDSP
ncbi:MAG: PKD domain-containing protein [Thermoanaerobaculia bacterium]|nr:PKD domain-containing protein [Thermoanaerobaculia bacterium]